MPELRKSTTTCLLSLVLIVSCSTSVKEHSPSAEQQKSAAEKAQRELSRETSR